MAWKEYIFNDVTISPLHYLIWETKEGFNLTFESEKNAEALFSKYRRFEFCKALKREYDASLEAISKETVNSLSDIVNQKLFDYYNNMPASHWVRWESRPLKGNCRLCTSLNDRIFHVKLAPSPPLHPHCKCQLVPADNETTRLIDSINEEELKRYTITSIKQLVLGNYTEDATILGTALSILFGLTGIDIIADVRDIVYDITNWKNNWKHVGQTTIDTVSVIPVLGVIKNIKTVGKLTKRGDKLFDAVNNASKGVVKTPAEIANSSPIKIPSSANIVEQTKTGYNQIKYTWSDGTYKYESRWHTRTPGAPEGQGNTWVVTRTTPGNATGQQKVQHILTGENQWTSMKQWQDAITASQNGTATAEQNALLSGGHWSAP